MLLFVGFILLFLFLSRDTPTRVAIEVLNNYKGLQLSRVEPFIIDNQSIRARDLKDVSNSVLKDFVVQNSKKVTYRILEVEHQRNRAYITVKLTYYDALDVVNYACRDYYNQPRTQRESVDVVYKRAIEMIPLRKSTIIETISIIRQRGVWKVEDVPAPIVDVYYSNVYARLKRY